MTKEEIIVSGTGKAIFLDNGKPSGNFGLESGQLLFTGVPETVGLQVAELLGAALEAWDNS